MTDVRIGIVSWNTAHLLDRCLAAIADAIAPFSAEVTVVDNASSDESAAVARSHPSVRVVENPDNVGYARAMNQALADTDAGVLIALNPDTVPAPGSLAVLVRLLDDQPDVGLVVPLLVNPDGSTQHSVYRFPSLSVASAVCLLPRGAQRGRIGRRFWLEGYADHSRPARIDWAIGAVHCIRRTAVGTEPPYNERWFMYVEDVDLCWQIHARGWQVCFEPASTVMHVGNASGAQAWGDTRTARWLDATYDWYALRRGWTAAWMWSGVQVAGVSVKWAFARAGALLPGPGRARRREWAGQMRFWLGLHGRKLVRGPRAVMHAADKIG